MDATPLKHLTGDGVFDSMRAYGGKIFRRGKHIERLFRSAASIGLIVPCSGKEIEREIRRALTRSGKKDAYVRVSLFRAGEGLRGPSSSPVRLNVTVTGVKEYPREYYRNGVEVVTVGTRKPHVNALFPHAKSLNFLSGTMARAEAGEAFEALMLNPRGYLTEGTVSNVFLVRHSRLMTPPLHLGILPGITRGKVMELAENAGMDVKEEVLTRHDLYNAGEVFLTNTTMEVMPVSKADGRIIGGGQPGNATLRLLRAFRRDTVKGT